MTRDTLLPAGYLNETYIPQKDPYDWLDPDVDRSRPALPDGDPYSGFNRHFEFHCLRFTSYRFIFRNCRRALLCRLEKTLIDFTYLPVLSFRKMCVLPRCK